MKSSGSVRLRGVACAAVMLAFLAGCEDSDVRLARDAMAAGDHRKALGFLAIAAERDPRNGEVQAMLAQAQAAAGSLPQATEALSQAKRLGFSGEIAAAATRKVQELAILKLELDPENATTALRLWPTPEAVPALEAAAGRINGPRGEVEALDRMLGLLEDLDKAALRRVHLLRGERYYRSTGSDWLERAAREYVEAARHGADLREVSFAAKIGEAFVKRAVEFRQEDMHEKAFAAADVAVRVAPGNAAAFEARAAEFAVQGKSAEALKDVTRAIEIAGPDSAYRMRAGAAFEAGQYRLAADDYTVLVDRARKAKRVDMPNLRMRLRAYIELGEFASALVDAEELLRTGDETATMSRGQVYERKGDLDLAMADYLEMTKSKDPYHAAAARERLARLLIARSEHAAALKEINAAMGVADYMEIFGHRLHMLRGDALLGLGRKSEAVEDFLASRRRLGALAHVSLEDRKVSTAVDVALRKLGVPERAAR